MNLEDSIEEGNGFEEPSIVLKMKESQFIHGMNSTPHQEPEKKKFKHMTPSYKAYEVAKATRDRFNEQYEVLNRSFGLEEGLDRKDDETQFIVANEELYAPLPPLVSRKNVR